MAGVLAEMGRLGPSRLSLVVQGPSGSGKELAARELHRLSRRPGPLVAVNCSALAESLLESELFGHVQGAYTGALRERKGALACAQGGTLFLDEVAELSPRLQALFLRVIQEREVRPVGSDISHRVDVRFLAATHRDLDSLAGTGAFRQDLLYRLQGAVLALPALAQRRHEFPYLIPRLVAQVATDAGRETPALEPGLPEALAARPWPGNFRQLLHALERALLHCDRGPLTRSLFPGAPVPPPRTWQQATREFQRELLLETLHRHQFQVIAAARALGLARPALYAAARRLGVDLAMERGRLPPDPNSPCRGSTNQYIDS